MARGAFHDISYNPRPDRLVRTGKPGSTVVVGEPGYAPARSIRDGDDPCPFCGGYEVDMSRVNEYVNELRHRKQHTPDWVFGTLNDCIVHECARCGATLTLPVDEL